jgi:diguanylate cyclase
MISQTMLLILGGCLLGAFQMTAGIALGMWLRRTKSTTPPSGRHEMIHASEIAKRLRSLADDMSSSVGEHRARLDNASQLLASNEGRSGPALAELVVGVIDEIVRANHHMQSKLETAESRLQEQANEIETYISRSLTDPLTGLPNRREFDNRMEERMAAWKRRQEIFSLLIVDVDHFKKLNDQHGHLAGDQMLAAMGKALRSAIRREDAVARYGGEEFAMLLPHTSLEQGVQVAQNVRDAVARISVDHNGQQLTVTASAGLATIQTDEHAELLIHRADAALYAAAPNLLDLIHNANPSVTTGDANAEGTGGFGAYLPAAEISAELAQTCDDLRRFIEERQNEKPAPKERATKAQGEALG